MSDRRNFTMDDETADLLEEHSEDNHSELVRELLKEYYTAGVYDTEQAALGVRRKQIERQLNELESEAEQLREEREALDDLVDEDATSDVEAVAEGITLNDPAMASADNPAIRTEAQKAGVDPAVLAEVVRDNHERQEMAKFSSVGDD